MMASCIPPLTLTSLSLIYFEAGTWAINELKRYGYQVDRQNFGKTYFDEKTSRDAMNYDNSRHSVLESGMATVGSALGMRYYLVVKVHYRLGSRNC